MRQPDTLLWDNVISSLTFLFLFADWLISLNDHCYFTADLASGFRLRLRLRLRFGPLKVTWGAELSWEKRDHCEVQHLLCEQVDLGWFSGQWGCGAVECTEWRTPNNQPANPAKPISTAQIFTLQPDWSPWWGGSKVWIKHGQRPGQNSPGPSFTILNWNYISFFI